MTKTKRMDLALGEAERLRRLVSHGRLAEADQVRKTIDDLVGYRTTAGRWAWPRRVQRTAFSA